MTEPREKRLLAEYLAWRYPSGGPITQFELGPTDAAVNRTFELQPHANVYQKRRKYVDALYAWNQNIILFEAKIRVPTDGIAQLNMYADLVPLTPELWAYKDWAISKVLVCTWADPQVNPYATQSGVQIELYRPAWVDEYFDWGRNYYTKEAREKRLERKKMREVLGLD